MTLHPWEGEVPRDISITERYGKILVSLSSYSLRNAVEFSSGLCPFVLLCYWSGLASWGKCKVHSGFRWRGHTPGVSCSVHPLAFRGHMGTACVYAAHKIFEQLCVAGISPSPQGQSYWRSSLLSHLLDGTESSTHCNGSAKGWGWNGLYYNKIFPRMRSWCLCGLMVMASFLSVDFHGSLRQDSRQRGNRQSSLCICKCWSVWSRVCLRGWGVPCGVGTGEGWMQ